MSNNNRVEVVFREDLRGRNALHFWIGVFVLGLGIYFWWTGLFSACTVEMNAAPPALESSYFARQGTTEGLSATGEGMGSATGAVSILFDTICLIGWGSLIVFTLMRRGLAALLERFGLVTGGLYEWAQANRKAQPTPPQATQTAAKTKAPAKPKTQAQKMFSAMKNHEARLQSLEAKTESMPMPEPPPKPKTVEEQLAEHAETIEKLQAELKKKK